MGVRVVGGTASKGRMSNTWNHAIPTLGWTQLSGSVRSHLLGARRFGVARVEPTLIVIDAYYDREPPAIEPFQIHVAGVALTVEVQTYELPPLLEGPPSAVVFDGLHAGSGIEVRASATVRNQGGVCMLLAPATNPSQPSHLVTCGHMFPHGAAGAPVYAARSPHDALVEIGTLAKNLLERTVPIDVALVLLNGPGITMAMGGGGPAIDGVQPGDDVYGFHAHAYQSTGAHYSAQTMTRGPYTESIDAPLWPGLVVTGVIGTTSLVTKIGDSGSILASVDNPGIALGVCIASDSDVSLAEPLGRALAAVASMNLQPWSCS